MSQVDELLEGLTDDQIAAYSADVENEPHIVIGADRYITVPDELKRIAVQYDHNVETVTFDCPRYWDEHDMSQMKVYINYKLPNNLLGSYIADDVTVDENDEKIIHFKWTISRNLTQVVGKISFLVCIKKTDDEGNESNHWNSELNQDLTVSQGLECETVAIDDNPDIITQLLVRMDTTETVVSDTVDTVNRLIDAANEALDDKDAAWGIVNQNGGGIIHVWGGTKEDWDKQKDTVLPGTYTLFEDDTTYEEMVADIQANAEAIETHNRFLNGMLPAIEQAQNDIKDNAENIDELNQAMFDVRQQVIPYTLWEDEYPVYAEKSITIYPPFGFHSITDYTGFIFRDHGFDFDKNTMDIPKDWVPRTFNNRVDTLVWSTTEEGYAQCTCSIVDAMTNRTYQMEISDYPVDSVNLAVKVRLFSYATGADPTDPNAISMHAISGLRCANEGDTSTISTKIETLSVDYIIEEGQTDDGWTYRKWNSGIAECWGTFNGRDANDKRAHENGIYSCYVTISHPSFLVSVDSVAYSAYWSNGYDFCGKTVVSYGLINYYIASLVDTGDKVRIHSHIIGRWK